MVDGARRPAPGKQTWLTLEEAARLAGRTVRTLRKHAREGKLVVDDGDGHTRVRAEELVNAGLLGAEALTPSVDPASPPGGELATAGTWLPAETGDMLHRLLAEREQAASAWKQQTESLYRELIDDQRARLERHENENRTLVSQLHEALRQVPKLLELENVESSEREARADLARASQRADAAEAQARELESRLELAEGELRRAEERGASLDDTVTQLRGRGLWDRLTGRE